LILEGFDTNITPDYALRNGSEIRHSQRILASQRNADSAGDLLTAFRTCSTFTEKQPNGPGLRRFEISSAQIHPSVFLTEELSVPDGRNCARPVLHRHNQRTGRKFLEE